ncbi:MAG: hypothetical protein JNK57_03860 [Planctomycetaceae bacterium]|nr:hypothetical protein [Planctomycetaceae bacterium]
MNPFRYSMQQLLVFVCMFAIVFWMYSRFPSVALLVLGSIILAMIAYLRRHVPFLFFLPVPIICVGHLQQQLWPGWAVRGTWFWGILIATCLVSLIATSVDISIGSERRSHVRSRVLLNTVVVSTVLGGLLGLLLFLTQFAAQLFLIYHEREDSDSLLPLLRFLPVASIGALVGGLLVGIPSGFIADMIVSHRRIHGRR